MKYSIKFSIIAASFTALTLGACNKDLDLDNPFGLTPSNAFTDLASFQRQLNGVYGAFASADYHNGYTMVTEIMADNCYETSESLVNFNQVHNWLFDAADRQRTYFQSMWVIQYNTILQANTIINNIDGVKNENVKRYNRILGQALAARAIAHFDLLKGYSSIGDRNSTALGVPIKTNTDLSFPGRNTIKEVYDAIYADLNNAITLLGDVDATINATGNRGYIDIWGARSALARVALYAKDYPTAITQATAVINQFPLATRAQFPGIWNDANAVEQIWNVQNISGDPGSPLPSAEIMSFRANRNTFGVLPAFISTFDTTGFAANGVGRDIRFTSYFFLRNTSANGNRNWALSKFRGKGTSSDNLVNFKVFRVSEMYLIRAEANALSNNATAANADLNTLKAARIENWVNASLSGQALVDEVAAERRRELCFEGHRWFDLKRTTRVVNRPMTNTGNANANNQTSLPSSSHRWVWPIVEVEMRANPAMAGQQNPGY
jgi:starch-binding outer membrane protein, SusD/RagB family